MLRAAEAKATQVAPVAAAGGAEQTAPNIAFVSEDEKPGLQAIANTAPDLPPHRGQACLRRTRPSANTSAFGTLSLLAGIDLLTGEVHATVEDRHRSREFVGFLKKMDAAYPTGTRDQGHSGQSFGARVEGDQKWLAAQREGRFEASCSRQSYGSWLNLVEGFFSVMARSVLRRIRVASER